MEISEKDMAKVLGNGRCDWCKYKSNGTVDICEEHMEVAVNCEGCAIDGLCICSMCRSGSKFCFDKQKAIRRGIEIKGDVEK